MIPIAPPPKFLNEVHSLISKFIWSEKRVRIKMGTLQRPKSAGGLAVPNINFYYWAFQIRALRVRMDPASKVPWRSIESALVKPHRLQDLLYAGVGRRNLNLRFGCINLNY